MTILAGIDEAGLGPRLGPLATAAAALRVPDSWRPDSPWSELADIFAPRRKGSDRRLAVADSKILCRTGGLAAMELTLAAFSLAANGESALPVAETDAGAAARHPCYDEADGPSPALNDAGAVEDAAGRLRKSLRRAGAEAAHLGAALLHEPALNRRFADGINKNQALLMETGRHIAVLAERFAGNGLVVVADKQGGRNSYLPFLSGLFPGMWIDTLEEGAETSAYRVRHPGGDVGIHFLAKADRTSFPTALASMAAKYARERAMLRLNRWFSGRFPGLRKTAGYPEDAKRWLAEVRKRCGDADAGLAQIIRTR